MAANSVILLLVQLVFLKEGLSFDIQRDTDTCSDVTIDSNYDPMGPRVLCCLLPDSYYQCDDPLPIDEINSTLLEFTNDTSGYCNNFGKQHFEEVENTTVTCRVLEGVECHGNRTFLKRNVPCVRYNGFYFPSIILFSVFLGLLGVDRFCLGYCCLGVAKLLTLGGIGVWWIVDVILLLTGNLTPSGGYNWDQYY